jgi:hypothetical protein
MGDEITPTGTPLDTYNGPAEDDPAQDVEQTPVTVFEEADDGDD